MADHSLIYDKINANRAYHLSTALSEAVEWLAKEKPFGRRTGEYKWLSRFRTPDVDTVTVHDFLKTFQLVRQGWDLEACTAVVNDMIADASFDPEVSIAVIADRFRPLTKSGYVQTSAATKFATFAKPLHQVFIWDQLATRSVRLHQWHVTGRSAKGGLADLYVNEGGKHSYPDYAAACTLKLEAERNRADFRETVAALTEKLDQFDGICADRSVVTPEFIERRLLDKLCFVEGDSIRALSKARNKAA
jgi:hypothetical protein